MTGAAHTLARELDARPTTMRAAVFTGGGRPLEIGELPVPEPGTGEVLVQVAACGLCHTDLHYMDHGVKTFKEPPLVLGHEISGTIVRAGGGVDANLVGSNVLLNTVRTCGDCLACRTGRENVCGSQKMLGNNVDGGFAQFVVCAARDAFPLPSELPLHESCIAADALTTAFHAVVRRAAVMPGETVAVFGCGGVGLSVVQVAVMVGARVIAVDLDPKKLGAARAFGASATIDAREADVPKLVRREAGGGGVEVAIEAIGRPVTQEQAVASLRTGARAILLGSSGATPMTLNSGRVMYRELSVIGTLGCRGVDFPVVIDLVRRGKLAVLPLVTHRHALEEINEGFDQLRRGEGIRHIVTL